MSSPYARRDPAVFTYDDPILPTKIAAAVDPVRCLAELSAGDAQRVAHVAGRVV